jgi:hypothetical protein
MSLGNMVDEFLNQHGLPDTGTTEQANLCTMGVGGKQVDKLETGLQYFSGS